MPGSSRSDRRRRKVDEAIRTAFGELLAEKGLKNVTVKELAERADIDRKTFYLRYSSIDGLVDSLLREEMRRLAEVLTTAAADEDGSVNVPVVFRELSAELIATFDQRAAVVQHVDTDALISRLRPAMADVLAERDALGLAEDLGPYFELFVSFFCSGLLALYHQWADSDFELPMEELATLAGSAIAGGIAAVTGMAKSLGISGKNEA